MMPPVDLDVRLATSCGLTVSALLRSETLEDIFRATAWRNREKIALRVAGEADCLTYGQLAARAEQVAGALAARGIGPGDFVGLWLPRSIEQHVALLGIILSGAAFVPLDAGAPAERVAVSLQDCGARALVVAGRPQGHDLGGAAVIGIEDLVDPAAATARCRPARAADTAYVIYTSGTTGKPKGIAVAHRSICHYLRAGNEVLGIEPSDVVLQQASLAFDLALEEIFIPYMVGATLVIATPATIARTDRLADVLDAEGITVIDTVPTLLGMLERDPTGVRLIILGGEACPPALVARFARPGRRLLNTYGPTEATVVATAGELSAEKPITIGRPIPNVSAYVVDEHGALVAPGEIGELLIGGPGVAKGYVGLPELTQRKFIANTFAGPGAPDPVLYRTGDAVAMTACGEFVFHGRIDTQVKVRGYRIELSEIEAAILANASVRMAAVAVHKIAGADTLVAHVVANANFDREKVREAIAAKLPPYMVPQRWHVHAELPVLASGKVDRKSLAAMPLELSLSLAPGAKAEAMSETERSLLDAAEKAFATSGISIDADFFDGLGGHSLLAATFVSEVRRLPHLDSIELRDVYEQRTIRKIAASLDARAGNPQETRSASEFAPPPLLRRFLCGLAQAIALPFIIAIVTAQWIGLLLTSIYLVRDNTPLWLEALFLCGVYVALNLGAKVLVVALKWLVIGRTQPGVYPLWGVYYFRLWLMQRLVHLTGHKFLQGSPLMRVYLRALGARVGQDAIVHEFEEGAIDLVSIGDRVSTGQKVRFANVEVIGNQVHVGRIRIDDDAYIGNACVLGPDVHIGARADIADLTCIKEGTIVAPGERWDGSPARNFGLAAAPDLPPHPAPRSRAARMASFTAYFSAYNLVMMVGLLPIFPAFYLLTHLDGLTFGDQDHVVPWAWVLLFAWPSALLLIFVSMFVVVAMNWLLLPSVKPSRHSIHSGFYFRKWVMGLATETMLETLNSLYATLFMRNWYRLMGCKVGQGTEISSNFAGRYQLIELGENNFIGDETIFGDEDVRQGWMTLDRVKTRDLCFFGNLSVVAKGAVIENGALIGVKSKLPETLHIRENETWFGSPPIAVPNRQRVVMGSSLTYRPPLGMRLLRLGFEALHTSLPTAVLISLAYMAADVIEVPIDRGDWLSALGVFLAAGIVVSFAMMAVSLAFKWLLMGVYRPTVRPMWSWWAMRTEAVAVLYGGLASKSLLDYVRGTPFLPMLLRLYGCKIGRGVYINSPDMTEFDCVEIGDFAVLNMTSSPQTHLYEDRVLKVGRIKIGRGATIGTSAIVLYDSEIGDFARVAPLTVVMKGERIPPRTHWEGAPAERSRPEVAAPSPKAAAQHQAVAAPLVAPVPVSPPPAAVAA